MKEDFANYIRIIEGKKKFKCKTLFLEITNKCNFKCKHCYNRSDETDLREITLEDFQKVFFDFISYGIDLVVLSGGEALLHPQIWKFIDMISKQGIRIMLLTNGKLLDEVTIDRLKENYVDIQISLDGGTEKTNDYLRHPGSFAGVISALDRLRKQEYSGNISINTVVCHQNKNEIGDIVKICERYLVPILSFNLLNNIGRAKENNLAVKDEDLFQLIECINNINDTTCVDVIKIDVTKECRFAAPEDEIFLTPVVDVFGNLYMCEFLRNRMFSIGNVFEEPLENILSADAIKRVMLLINMRRFFISKCHQCGVSSSCLAGCIAQSRNNNYFEPQYCLYIKKRFLYDLGAEKL